MDHELMEELRDAGLIWEDNHPDLLELIKACGEDLKSLSRLESGRWYANTRTDDGHGNYIDSTGSTPEEAVAHLWLALNE